VQGFPYAARDQAVGLLGGSFDPAHEGHVRITREALKRFGLDQVWWLVSPGNPLKKRQPASLGERLAMARNVMRHPRVKVTALEAQLGTRRTADTIAVLRSIYPGVRFVWLMGADNLAQLHEWDNWRAIMDSVPVGVFARPGDRISARTSVAAQTYRNHRLSGSDAQLLGQSDAPAWAYVNIPMSDHSSTEIRASGRWIGGKAIG
jgi:nicotinate-nucleotide adenylyltransferase